MDKLDRIMALADKLDGALPSRLTGTQKLYRLELTSVERNMIADALTVLYGHEKAALTSTERQP